MNKLELARSLARKSHRSRAKAADDVDTLVYRLLKELKKTSSDAPLATQSSVAGPLPPKGKQ